MRWKWTSKGRGAEAISEGRGAEGGSAEGVGEEGKPVGRGGAEEGGANLLSGFSQFLGCMPHRMH